MKKIFLSIFLFCAIAGATTAYFKGNKLITDTIQTPNGTTDMTVSIPDINSGSNCGQNVFQMCSNAGAGNNGLFKWYMSQSNETLMTLQRSGILRLDDVDGGIGASTPSYSFVSNTNSGMYSNGSNGLNFTANGTLALSISSGQVVNVPQLTASRLVATDSSKNLVSSSMTAPTFTAISSNVTLACGAYNFVSTAAARSLTLPTPASGCVIKIKDITGTASSNNISVLRAASEKIENVAATKLLITDFGAWELVSDGTDWWMF